MKDILVKASKTVIVVILGGIIGNAVDVGVDKIVKAVDKKVGKGS